MKCLRMLTKHCQVVLQMLKVTLFLLAHGCFCLVSSFYLFFFSESLISEVLAFGGGGSYGLKGIKPPAKEGILCLPPLRLTLGLLHPHN